MATGNVILNPPQPVDVFHEDRWLRG